MEYLRGWRALRKDPQWITKVLIGTLFSLIPVVGPIVVTGWLSLALRRAVSGQDAPLPRLDFDFEYLKNLVMAGFKGFLAQLLWSLPLVVVFMGAYAGCIVSAVVVAGASRSSGNDPGLAMLIVALVFCVVMPILIIGASLPLNIARMRAEITDDLGAARIKEVFGMTRLMMKELIVGQLVLMCIGFGVLLPFGLITLTLGLYPAAIVMQVIATYWLAEVYRRYLEKGGEPLPVGPLEVPGTVPAPQAPPPQL